MYALLQYSLPDGLDVGRVPCLQSQDGDSYLGRRPAVEVIEPTTERAMAQAVDVFPSRNGGHVDPSLTNPAYMFNGNVYGTIAQEECADDVLFRQSAGFLPEIAGTWNASIVRIRHRDSVEDGVLRDDRVLAADPAPHDDRIDTRAVAFPQVL